MALPAGRSVPQGDPPAPVLRYLRHVQAWRHAPVQHAQLEQRGVLRSSTTSRRWMPFTAQQEVRPGHCAFTWEARVRLMPLLSLEVRDACEDGRGSGRVRLLGATIAADAGRPELNEAALHRYLAEAVWYPTALLPGTGVRWTPLDDACARASLTHGGCTVELEFHFTPGNEVSAVRAEGRWQRFGKGYRRVPWQGRLADYRTRQGLRVPTRAEVGWERQGQLDVVWKGEVTALKFAFGAG